MKVLMVEDDYFNSQLVFEILIAQSFKAEIASDGPEAISMTENELYDLILMDIELAKMDGIEATRLIKNKFFYKDIPIIDLTAYASKGDKERILASGMDDYISKPIDIPDFIKKMEEYRIRERKI